MLLERQGEAAVIAAAVAVAREAGSGALFVLEGPAGMGKSALLDAVRSDAAAGGMAVLAARAGDLERDLPYGVVRQLLEAQTRRAPHLLAGAAALAAPAVLPESGTHPAEIEDRRAPVVHGLYWLTANLASERPLLLTVDDAQCSDLASLHYLAYLARRVAELPVVVLVAVRSGEGRDPALHELTGLGRTLALQPLTDRAVSTLVRAGLGGDPDPAFVAACCQASGGVPFLLAQLLLELGTRQVAPTADGAAAVTRTTSDTVGQATLARLAVLDPHATTVAHLVAVLDRHATASRVAKLGALESEEVLRSIDTLCAARILVQGTPLRFVHPIVRASVDDALAVGARSIAHAAAARLLAAEGAPEDDVATHIMATEAGTVPDAGEILQRAARSALRRGAPASAVTYLRRCVRETPGIGVLHTLGQVESLLRDPQAPQRLRAALERSDDPVERARITLDLLAGELIAGRWDAVRGEVDRALIDLGPREPELALGLELFRAGMTWAVPAHAHEFAGDLPRLTELASGTSPSARRMASLLAGYSVGQVQRLPQVHALAEHALAGDELLQAPDAVAWAPQSVTSLAYLGEFDQALAAADVMRAASSARGSAYGFALACSLRAQVFALRGDLRAVEAEVRACFGTVDEDEQQLGIPTLLHWALDALLERPDLQDVVAVAESVHLTERLADSLPGALLLESRGRLRLQQGRRAEARADLTRCAQIMSALGMDNPQVCAWRSALAQCVPDRDEARELVAQELALGAAIGSTRRQGIALRVAALLPDAGERLPGLQRSAELLVDVPLERARSLAAVGSCLRRGGSRRAADEPLRAALELAHRCGAERLAREIEQELRAIGARPRSRARSGVDALTPSEARVAVQAARGMTNREIAQELFVTAKTVENQLGRVYQKLGIAGRSELARALTGES